MYDIFYIGQNKDGWQNLKDRYPHARKTQSYTNPYSSCASDSFTKMFWIVPGHVDFGERWDFSVEVANYDTGYLHLYPISHPSSHAAINPYEMSLQLWPCDLAKTYYGSVLDFDYLYGKIKICDEIDATFVEKFDIFFVSYNEPNADENWAKLYSRFPHAKRIDGIKGIDNAHRACAQQSSTDMFWTVDADTIVDDVWQFDYFPSIYERDFIHVWYTRNPVNGLEYGYGAVKLWPKIKVLEYQGSWLDYTTSAGQIKIINHTVATTIFNSSPFESWKSAFRECIKLMHNIHINPNDTESVARLDLWKNTTSEVQFANWCKLGAQDAESWYQNQVDNILFINDFSWLKQLFQAKYSDVA